MSKLIRLLQFEMVMDFDFFDVLSSVCLTYIIMFVTISKVTLNLRDSYEDSY